MSPIATIVTSRDGEKNASNRALAAKSVRKVRIIRGDILSDKHPHIKPEIKQPEINIHISNLKINNLINIHISNLKINNLT